MDRGFVVVACFYTDWTGSTEEGEVESLTEDTEWGIVGVADDEEKAALLAESFVEDHRTVSVEKSESVYDGPLESVRVYGAPRIRHGIGECVGEVSLSTGSYKSAGPRRTGKRR